MESPTNTQGDDHPQDGGAVIEQSAKNARASKSEMDFRQKEVISLLRKNKTADIYTIASALSLTNPQAVTLLGNLMKANLIEKAGREGRRILYRAKASHAVATAPVVPTQPTPVPPVGLPVHLGEQLEVVGIHITGEGVEIEVNGDGKTLTLVA